MNRRLIKRLWRGLPLLLIPIGIHTQQFYVNASRGVGGGFVEIPRASRHRLIDELKRISGQISTPTVITDSVGSSFIKFQSAYMEGRRFLVPVKNFFPDADMVKSVLKRQEFDLKPLPGGPRLNGFQTDTRVDIANRDPSNVTLLVSTGNQSVLNRFSYPENSRRDILPIPLRDSRNHLLFIHSDRGESMMTFNRLRTSMFPIIVDGLTNTAVAPIGRYLLFRVLNPTAEFRLLLNLSTLDHRLPPAAVVGETRESLDFTGFGSGRVISRSIKPQLIEGVPYICVDMGMDGIPFREKRTGLMRLWRMDVPIDFKLLVGLARNISIITEDQYRRFTAPPGVRVIPDDFLNPEFEYSGIYEDGWMSANSYSILQSSSALEPFVVRGVVPITHDLSFKTNMTVRIDGQEIGRRTIPIGEFEYRFPVVRREGRRRVEILFDRTQALLYNDNRRAAVLLRCMGFGSKSCLPRAGLDVVEETRGIWRGDNWYALEKQNGTNFRWVNTDAEILVAPEVQNAAIAVDVEPGPGLHGQPLNLQAVDTDGRVLVQKNIHVRQKLQFNIPERLTSTNGFYAIRLRSITGGQLVPGDSRVLNFRVFHAALQTAAAKPAVANDIAAVDDVIQLGDNWYPPESAGADHFRWVDNDSVVRIADPRTLAKGLVIELEPGPGVRKRPMVLRVLDAAGRQVQAVEVNGRQTVNIFPPSSGNKPVEYRLHAEGGGQKIASDPRILNFRVFKIYSPGHGVNKSGDITEGAGLQVGHGWYPVESFTDGTFRWVNNDAEFTVNARHTRLEVELQPGPGVDFKKMLLKVLDASGRQVQATEVDGRQKIKLLVPGSSKGEMSYRLHVDGGGKKIPSDPRILNFRVFKLKILD